MSATAEYTVEDLEQLPKDEARVELVAGELRRMTPAKAPHAKVANRVQFLLTFYADQNQQGTVYAELGCNLFNHPDTVRVPEVSYLSQAYLTKHGEPNDYLAGAPSLAIEVLSPSNRPKAVRDKIEEYFLAGGQAVWVINLKQRSVTVYDSPQSFNIYKYKDVLPGGKVLPGFSCQVAAIFQ